MVEQYRRFKRFLPTVLRDLYFQAAPAVSPVLAANNYLAGLSGTRKCVLDDYREEVCRAQGHPASGDKAMSWLAAQLDETWKAVASHFDSNMEVQLCHAVKYPTLTISGLDKMDEPPSLVYLNRRGRQLLPPVDLTELLLEIDARTGFTREFIHVSESGARAQDVYVSLCATIMSEA